MNAFLTTAFFAVLFGIFLESRNIFSENRWREMWNKETRMKGLKYISLIVT